MATSEAQKRASAKYRKNNVKAIMFNLYPSDSDLIEFLEGKENRSSYIKELIRKDMNNSKKLAWASAYTWRSQRQSWSLQGALEGLFPGLRDGAPA